MPTARNHLGAAVVNGKIHAVGGRVGGNFTMTEHEVYDVATNAWTSAPPVPTGRSGIAVVELAGKIYVFGGEVGGAGGKTFDEAEQFDPAGRWESLPRMPTARHGLGAAGVSGAIYVISGGPAPGFAFSGANERLVPQNRSE
jgi:N-acetylneuraminic acid mutarotase